MKSILVLLIFLILPSFVKAKSVIMPRDFLAPKVYWKEASVFSWELLQTKATYFGGRTTQKATEVKLSEKFDVEHSHLKVKLTVKNSYYHVMILNMAIVSEKGKVLAIKPLSTDWVGKLASTGAEMDFNLSIACQKIRCDFTSGVYVYFYIHEKLITDFREVDMRSNIVGTYYRLIK